MVHEVINTFDPRKRCALRKSITCTTALSCRCDAKQLSKIPIVKISVILKITSLGKYVGTESEEEEEGGEVHGGQLLSSKATVK